MTVKDIRQLTFREIDDMLESKPQKTQLMSPEEHRAYKRMLNG